MTVIPPLCDEDVCWLQVKSLSNLRPLAVVDDVGTLDFKTPETFASKIGDVGSMLETSPERTPPPCALGRLR